MALTVEVGGRIQTIQALPPKSAERREALQALADDLGLVSSTVFEQAVKTDEGLERFKAAATNLIAGGERTPVRPVDVDVGSPLVQDAVQLIQHAYVEPRIANAEAMQQWLKNSANTLKVLHRGEITLGVLASFDLPNDEQPTTWAQNWSCTRYVSPLDATQARPGVEHDPATGMALLADHAAERQADALFVTLPPSVVEENLSLLKTGGFVRVAVGHPDDPPKDQLELWLFPRGKEIRDKLKEETGLDEVFRSYVTRWTESVFSEFEEERLKADEIADGLFLYLDKNPGQRVLREPVLQSE